MAAQRARPAIGSLRGHHRRRGEIVEAREWRSARPRPSGEEMGGTWTAGLEGPGRIGLAERQGPAGAHWQARVQACIEGQVRMAPTNGGKSVPVGEPVALLRRLRCSRTGRSDREAPVLSRPSTWPHRGSWMFERDRKRETRTEGETRGKKKIVGSGTAREGGTEKRDDWREGGAVSRGATRVRAWIIRSRVTRGLSRRICIEGNGA